MIKIKECERIIPEKVIPEKIITYWKTSDDREFNNYAHAELHQKSLNTAKAFEGVKKDSVGYWPQNTARYGDGYKHIFASESSVRNWLRDNEELVMNFYKKVGELDNETK